jgi:uncharacterized protein (TIGR02265 family)
MTERQLVFDNAVEGLFIHGLKGRLTPALKGKLRDLGVDLDRKLLPAYERAVWAKALQVTADELFAGLPVEHAAREMGYLVARGWDATMVGKAMIAFARVVGPKRTLERLTRSLGAANTYVRAELVCYGEKEFELRCGGLDFSPHFMGGIVEGSLQLVRAQEPKVALLSSQGEKAVFQLSWRS